MGFVIFGNDHDAAGILIQPVHDTGADHPVDARQVLTVKQQRIDQRARIMPRRRMHHHAPGFIEHDHIFIFIDDIQRNVFRLRFQCFPAPLPAEPAWAIRPEIHLPL